MTSLQRNLKTIRREGWTVTGNRVNGYLVRQGTAEYQFDVAGLIEFGGQDKSS